jgi:16S rRNA (guanine966-N2)-methyltransferase
MISEIVVLGQRISVAYKVLCVGLLISSVSYHLTATQGSIYPLVNRTTTQSRQSVRIIAGKWRSRQLAFIPVEGLRPTGDRIRETLFNWLMPQITGARCIDLFAGSGALCFEALSRGAKSCVAIEKNPRAATELKANKSKLGAQDLTVVCADSKAYLQQSEAEDGYHIVFLDPPFQSGLYSEIIQALCSGDWLAEGALIYCELPISESCPIPQDWQLLKEKTAGKVRYCLYKAVG